MFRSLFLVWPHQVFYKYKVLYYTFLLFDSFDVDDVTTKMTKASPRTSANLAALFLACITCVITNIAAAAMFPFFSIVASKQTSSTLVIGFVFAIMFAATAITSLIVPLLSARFGRLPVLNIGLIGGAVSLTGFGFSSRIGQWLFFRAAQGISMALINGPSTALILAHSVDVAEDMGIVEATLLFFFLY